jgi:hypothetical protein
MIGGEAGQAEALARGSGDYVFGIAGDVQEDVQAG